jgi:AcrR family transcriptional regulator
VATVTTAHRSPAETGRADDNAGFRQRLLDGLAASIIAEGYRDTTVADIVRRARTSRRTFYEHFEGKEACFVALLGEINAEIIRQIAAAVDPRAPWQTQVRQALGAWIAGAEREPALTLSWIRDVPALGPLARQLQHDTRHAFVTLIETLCASEGMRATGIGPMSNHFAVMLYGALQELAATTVEAGGRISDITETAVSASIALLSGLATTQ